MKTKSLLNSVLLISAGSLLLTGCVIREPVYSGPPPAPGVAVETPGVEVEVGGPPPPPIVEVQPVIPGPGFIWIDGFWGWGPHGWVWTRGYWGHPPHPGMRWYGPHYDYRGGRHVWHRGYWR